MMRRRILAVIIAVIVAVCAVGRTAAHDSTAQARLLSAYANVPLAFVENRGQVDPRVRLRMSVAKRVRRIRHDHQRRLDAFLAELNAAGSMLLHGTFLGGSDPDGASDLALDRVATSSSSGRPHRATSPRRPARPIACGMAIR
jgi:hypothetical protein